VLQPKPMCLLLLLLSYIIVGQRKEDNLNLDGNNMSEKRESRNLTTVAEELTVGFDISTGGFQSPDFGADKINDSSLKKVKQ